MKLQLLLLVCLAVLASGLATDKSSRRPFRRALNSAPAAFRANKDLMQTRDDDNYICYFSTCWEIDYDEPCLSNRDCDDDEYCFRGFCCEYEGGFCRRDRDCYYFDDDDDDDDK